MQSGVRGQAVPSELIARSPAHIRGWLLALTVGVAAAMRLWHLGAKSLWLDEAASIEIARWNLHSVWQAAHQPPSAALFYWYQSLYYFLLHFWLQLGDSEWVVRLPSAIFGIATIILLYVVAARLFSPRVALIASLLLAVHPFHLAYSQEARSYAICVFLVTASYALLIAAFEKRSMGVSMLYALVTAAAIYSHLYAAVILPAQLVAVGGRGNQDRRRIFIVMVAVGVLAAPMFWLALTQNAGQNDWTPPLSAKDILHAAQQFIGTGVRFPIGLALLLLAGISMLRKVSGLGWGDVLVWSWLLVPALGIVTISLIAPPFAPRYLLLCLPACVILLALALDRLPWPRATNSAAILLALLYFFSSLSYYRKPKEEWRDAAALVAKEMQPKDRILFDREYGRIPLNYYLQRTSPEIRPRPIAQAELTKLSPSERLWIVLYGPAHHGQSMIEESIPAGLGLQEQHDFEAITVLLYAR